MLGDVTGGEVTAPAPLPGPTERSTGKALGAEGPGAEARGTVCPKKDDGHPKMCPGGSPPSAPANLPSFSHLLCGFEEFGLCFPPDTQAGG